MATDVFSGARARLKIDNNTIGYCGGISGEESIDYEPIDVLDLIHTKEHVPIAYRCGMNAQVFRVLGESLKNQGIMPIEDNILTDGVMEAQIEDKVTGRIAAQISGVKVATKAFDVTARGIVAENVSFVAIRMKDESEV
jgi:hypothetical protein